MMFSVVLSGDIWSDRRTEEHRLSHGAASRGLHWSVTVVANYCHFVHWPMSHDVLAIDVLSRGTLSRGAFPGYQICLLSSSVGTSPAPSPNFYIYIFGTKHGNQAYNDCSCLLWRRGGVHFVRWFSNGSGAPSVVFLTSDVTCHNIVNYL